MAKRCASAGSGPLQRRHAGGADNFRAPRGVTDAFFIRGTVQQFKHQRAHGVDARVAGTHKRDVLTKGGLFEGVATPRFFATKGEIAAGFSGGERAEKINIQSVAHQFFGVSDKAGHFGCTPRRLPGADTYDRKAATGTAM